MKLNDYQLTVSSRLNSDIIYTSMNLKARLSLNSLALCGEAGEVANKIKKLIWYDPEWTDDKVNSIKDELCDILFHLSQLGTEFGMTMTDLADRAYINMTKKPSLAGVKNE
jgi:NTP pyrophosphatase (non-canonical NTP hydrolase)